MIDHAGGRGGKIFETFHPASEAAEVILQLLQQQQLTKNDNSAENLHGSGMWIKELVTIDNTAFANYPRCEDQSVRNI